MLFVLRLAGPNLPTKPRCPATVSRVANRDRKPARHRATGTCDAWADVRRGNARNANTQTPRGGDHVQETPTHTSSDSHFSPYSPT